MGTIALFPKETPQIKAYTYNMVQSAFIQRFLSFLIENLKYGFIKWENVNNELHENSLEVVHDEYGDGSSSD
ncbi:hypothetical protein ACA30_01780 [Virgibacillus soli]|uniref:Uncharacterized protein n=1 Tax=Lederbergia galactosidilytica TaxID=217031 RepID=A0A0Q9XZJ7_9BACI|nr:hypothetical protein ACA29_07155 [Lederbergia galactosidilytica]KRG16450.1 hypothetical protein ACA30_01780 [Virgibacillus soli]OAK67327.1 hypothetical protein ABB05_19425 [Lederbergia galactosidilytica]